VSFKVKALPREFVLSKGNEKVSLADPNPDMTPSEVLQFYSHSYPELTNGSVSAPDVKSNKIVYTVSTVVGKKG
jgi:PRTRC genetic system protein C